MRRNGQLLLPAGDSINLCTGILGALGELMEEVAVGNVVQ